MEQGTTRRRRRSRRDDDEDKPNEAEQSAVTAAATDSEANQAAIERPPLREDVRAEMRGPLREESSRQEAERVAAEILDRNRGVDPDYHDDFQLPPGVQEPDGWEYQWKRRLAGGAEDPGYQVSLQQAGWRAVPASRHPELMPINGHYEIIERKGLVLMECPRIVTDHQRMLEKRRALERVRISESRLGQTPAGQFDRSHPQARPNINKSYEPMPVPKE